MTDVDINYAQPRIVLARMRQQEEVRSAEDDWTGSTDAAERRKRQNRIHQRLYSECLVLMRAEKPRYFGDLQTPITTC